MKNYVPICSPPFQTTFGPGTSRNQLFEHALSFDTQVDPSFNAAPVNLFSSPRSQQKPAQCGNAAASKNNTFASNLEFPAQGSTLSSAGLKLEKM
jgi:hypothetical protein